MTLFARAYLAARDLDTSGDDHRDGGPVVPGTWTVRRQGATGWWHLTTAAGEDLAVLKVNALGGRGLFAAFGPKPLLDSIASGNDEVMPAREAWRRRADDTAAPGEASPREICRAWRWYRVDVTEPDPETALPVDHVGVVRRLCSEGVLLPDPAASPLPWPLDDDGRLVALGTEARLVTAIHRPALGHTLAGHPLDVRLEDEPDRGA